MLPNLIIIGAAKAGTTSLHRYLKVHPEIWMSPVKELNFFDAGVNWDKGVDWYSRWFPRALPVRGESSPKYTSAPWCTGAAERMASVIPDAKLVYVVRDPLERMISDYVDAAYHGIAPWLQPFDALVRDPASRVYSQSLYWTQLQPFRACYPDERILVVDHHELLHRRGEALRRIFEFLGVDPTFTHPSFARVHNASRHKRQRKPFAQRLSVRLDRALSYYVSLRVREWVPSVVSRAFTEEIMRPELPPDLRPQLEEVFHEEAERLRAWSGLPLASWSV